MNYDVRLLTFKRSEFIRNECITIKHNNKIINEATSKTTGWRRQFPVCKSAHSAHWLILLSNKGNTKQYYQSSVWFLSLFKIYYSSETRYKKLLRSPSTCIHIGHGRFIKHIDHPAVEECYMRSKPFRNWLKRILV